VNRDIFARLSVLLILLVLTPPASAQQNDCVKAQNYYLTVISTPQSNYPDNLQEVLVQLFQDQGYIKQAGNLRKEGIDCFISTPISAADGNPGLVVYFYSKAPDGFPAEELESLRLALSNSLKSLNYNDLRVWIMRQSETLGANDNESP
jgi:hypothetical protein